MRINILTAVQTFKLVTDLKANYVASGLNDKLYAEKVTKELGFTVGQHQVCRLRADFSIPANKPRRIEKPEPSKMFERVAALEAEIAQLKATVNKLASRIDSLTD